MMPEPISNKAAFAKQLIFLSLNHIWSLFRGVFNFIGKSVFSRWWYFQDAIAEETYNPYLAGLSSAFDIQPWGISLRVSGYDEKQQLFTRDLIRRLVNFEPGLLFAFRLFAAAIVMFFFSIQNFSLRSGNTVLGFRVTFTVVVPIFLRSCFVHFLLASVARLSFSSFCFLTIS